MIKLLERHLPTVLNSLLLYIILSCEWKSHLSLKPRYLLLFGIIQVLLACFCQMKLRNKMITIVSFLLCILLILWKVPRETIMHMQGLLLACLCSFLFFFFQLAAERFLPLRLLTAVVLTLWMIIDVFTNRQLQHLTIVCAFGYLIITYIMWVRKHWNRQGSHPDRPYLMWILPFLTIYIMLMFFMPAPTEPYDWKFVKDFYHKLLTFTGNLPFGKKEDFQVSSSGFSEDGRLLGNFVQDSQEVMLLQPKNDLQTNVYLTGKVYDTFTGSQWLQTAQYKQRDRKLDMLETLCAVHLYNKEQAPNYIRAATIGITYQDFYTGYLFAPLKTWKVIGDNLTYTDENGSLLFDEKKGYGTTYDSYFFQLNADHEIFYEFLEAELTPEKEVWNQLAHAYGLAFEEKLTMTDLENHRKNISGLYGTSYEISPRVQSLLQEMTQNTSTDIDKLKAIEETLSSMEYTRTPGALPEDITSAADFLDYFLLENKQGYCSYFATAFVLLARAEGIPARYVEGFCVSTEGMQQVTVCGYQAHAWPEVYIEGVGWIPFEPTPGYAQIRYTPWEEKDYSALQENNHNPEEEPMEDVLTSDTNDTSDTLEKSEQGQLLQILGYILLLLLTLFGVFFLTDKLINKRRYAHWSLEQRFLAEIRQNLQILALLGYKRLSSETLTELAERAHHILTYEQDGRTKVLEFILLYEEFLYNHLAVNEALLLQLLHEQDYLLETLKRYKYRTYLYYKLTKRGGKR